MSVLPLPEAIHRFKGNDERVEAFVNGDETTTWQTSTGEVMPSIAKFLFDRASDIDYLREQLGQHFGYSMVIQSSHGTVFRVGQNTTTTLIARVWRNGEELTSLLPASWFRWRRQSVFPQPFPNDDATWNAQFQNGGYKTVTVSVDQVLARAAFICDLQPE